MDFDDVIFSLATVASDNACTARGLMGLAEKLHFLINLRELVARALLTWLRCWVICGSSLWRCVYVVAQVEHFSWQTSFASSASGSPAFMEFPTLSRVDDRMSLPQFFYIFFCVCASALYVPYWHCTHPLTTPPVVRCWHRTHPLTTPRLVTRWELEQFWVGKKHQTCLCCWDWAYHQRKVLVLVVEASLSIVPTVCGNSSWWQLEHGTNSVQYWLVAAATSSTNTWCEDVEMSTTSTTFSERISDLF